MRLTDGVSSHQSIDSSQWLEITSWNLSNLRLVTDGGLPGDYSLSYRLTSVEGANGSSTSVEESVQIRVDEVLPQVDAKNAAHEQVTSRTASEAIDETSQVDKPVERLIVGSATDRHVEATTSVNPEIFIAVDANTFIFEEDINASQEFDWLLQGTSRDSSSPATPSFQMPELTDQMQGSLEANIATGGVRTMEEFEQAVNSLQEITEAEEQIRQQSTLQEQTERGFSIQGSLIAIWNLLRANVVPQDNSAENESRGEVRVVQRATRRGE